MKVPRCPAKAGKRIYKAKPKGGVMQRMSAELASAALLGEVSSSRIGAEGTERKDRIVRIARKLGKGKVSCQAHGSGLNTPPALRFFGVNLRQLNTIPTRGGIAFPRYKQL